MKLLNSPGPNTDPWGTLLITDLHLDIETLTTTLDVAIQPIPHDLTVHLSNLYLPNFERRMLWGFMLKALQMSR